MAPRYHVIQCPNCPRRFRIPDTVWGRAARCPGCARIFVLDRRLTPPLEEAPPPRFAAAPPAVPRLTAPHRCPNQACGHPSITEPLGQRVTQYFHQECLQTHSLYAALYRCPQCLTPALLESPRWQWGQTILCPFADHEVVVPNDHFFRHVEEGPRFAFDCPACLQRLEVASFRAGEWGVCPRCQLAIAVPPGGTAIESGPPLRFDGTGTKPGDPVVVRGHTCGTCGTRYPFSCSQCPVCARPL